MWDHIIGRLLTMGTQYGVDPLVFATIYVAAIPLLALSIAWTARNVRAGKSLLLPVCSTTICLISTYLYLLIAGQNLPSWMYLAITVALLLSAASTWIVARKKAMQVIS